MPPIQPQHQTNSLKEKIEFYKIVLQKPKLWRLQNLYKIVDEFSRLITFTPNRAQLHFHNNKHQRNVILKSRRLGFCLDPKTRVLTADLLWKEIKDLTPGQEIIAVDEFPPGGRCIARKMRTAKVEKVVIVHRKAYKIYFDDGRSVICTGKHPWLAKKSKVDPRWRSIEHIYGDKTSGKLTVGTKVRWITKPWENISTYEDGWYGGILDGEGNISKKNHSAGMNASQRDGDVLERMINYVKDRGYHYHIESKMYENDPTRQPNHKVVVGRMDEMFRLIGQTRASRFLKNRFWEGRELPGKRNGNVGWATIIKIEELGERDMVDLQTSTGTYIAEGFVSHNTTYSVIDLLDNTLFTKNFNSLFISYDDASSQKVFDEMALLAWNHFPLQELFRIDTDNAKQLRLDWGDKTYSTLEVKSSGRGSRTNQIHVSELGKIAAKYPAKAKEIFTGTIKSLTPDGFLTIESTAEEAQGEFYDIFWNSLNDQLSHPNHIFQPHEYKAHFYNWQWDDVHINTITQPDSQLPKDFKDYQLKHNEKAKKRPDLFKPISDIQITFWFYEWIKLNKKWPRLFQEMPTTPEEAFVSNSSKLFDQFKVEELQLKATEAPTISNNWLIYEDPKTNHNYIIAADPAEGVGGDHSAIIILDTTPKHPKVVATFQDNHIPPDLLAFEIKTYGRAYNYALAMVERNNTGFATITQLKLIYPPEFIYKEEKLDKENTEETERLGWHTNLVTKPKMFYDLSTAVNEELLDIPSLHIISEMKFYDRSQTQRTNPDPEATNHFDLLTALAIAVQGLSSIQAINTPLVTTNVSTSQHSHDLNPLGTPDSNKSNFNPFAAI